LGSLEYILMPTLECLVLVGIHSYLGIHVIRRKVIFVDLALAQLAALGATVGFLFGIMPETPAAFIFSIVFATAGAAVFATTRMRSERVPHEAVIGLVYAIAAALAILVIDRAPSGAEHLKNVLVGRIEWVRGHEVAVAAVVYALIGVVHWIFRRPFYLISERPDEAFAKGMRVRAWDFLFYLTFGVVISISVKVAGVLLVFVFLVVPAIAAVMITDNHLRQLLIGWGMGTVVTVLGMLVSYHASLPSGPTVVAVYGIVLVLIALVLFVVRSERRGRSIVMAALGTGIAAAFVALLVLLGMGLKSSPLGRTKHHHEQELVDPSGAPHVHHHEGHGTDDRQVDEADEAAPADPDEILVAARAKIEAGDAKGAVRDLIRILEDEDEALFYKEKALAVIEEQTGEALDYDPEADPGDNADALRSIRAWLDAP
jgi:zinc/manganese transport system permease protein